MEPDSYTGLRFSLTHINVNDAVLPTKGIGFLVKAQVARDNELEEYFQVYSGKLQFYIPLGKKFSIASKAGGTTVSGDRKIINSVSPYQHAMIGGAESFRGFRMERFWGKTSFYNNNELRFITQMRSRLLNADIGVLGFFDNGRVWMPDEDSDLWHMAWGGGLILAPFHAMAFQLTYGVSPESRLVQLRLIKAL
jgi:outer membrane protein assembly factor BamA